MAYEVFCRKKNGHVVNELKSKASGAVELFLKLAKTQQTVHLIKRRKTKFKDGWRVEEKHDKDTLHKSKLQ